MFLACAFPAAALELRSPDGKLVLTFELAECGGAKGCPVYRLTYKGQPVLTASRLGLQLDGASLDEGLSEAAQSNAEYDETWTPVCAERDRIRDHFNQLTVRLRESQPPQRRLDLTFRAYDEGLAFRYELPEQEALTEFTIKKERTSFCFAADHTAWPVYAAQGLYTGGAPLSKLKPGVERPLTVRLSETLYASITEAALVDYARMKLRPLTGTPFALEAFLDAERGVYGTVTGRAPFVSPWRVVMVAESPGRLLEQNYLILNLNAPCALKDTAWIKPGKVIREVTLSTAGGKACVDFCVQQGLQYIEFDAGWYGHEYDPKSDAREVHLDPKRNPNPNALNLQEVIQYADAKGIGVILYVNHLALEKQLDEVFPRYEKWGVKGVKFGFVNVGSQRWTRWLHEAFRKAADHHLLVDVHDEFRSTGYQRTYPNLMTVEGLLGNEGFPTPQHHATLPFTRFLTGPADYTYCWYSPKLKPTHAHQLALSTLFFSPWQFLYWYDRPASFDGDPALEYWKHLPTTWDETRVLKGEIGQSAAIARRKGNEWYVGAIQPGGPAKVELPLAFLAPARKYTATVYSDLRPENPESKAVRIETQQVDAAAVLRAEMPPNGGLAARIVPAAE